jgi:hypothetical protein
VAHEGERKKVGRQRFTTHAHQDGRNREQQSADTQPHSPTSMAGNLATSLPHADYRNIPLFVECFCEITSLSETRVALRGD